MEIPEKIYLTTDGNNSFKSIIILKGFSGSGLKPLFIGLSVSGFRTKVRSFRTKVRSFRTKVRRKGYSSVFTQKRSDNKGIEYVRKDAFINKACEWIKYNNENGGCLFDGWEEDFKKYMEE